MSEQKYISQISHLEKPPFSVIRRIAVESISHLSQLERERLHRDLEHGKKELTTHEEMCQYLFSYGTMHESKIHYALEKAINKFDSDIFENEVTIIDWGCGQGLATLCFLDYLNSHNINIRVNKIKLIDPSSRVLERAKLHVSTYIEPSKIETYNKYFEDLTVQEIMTNNTTIHFF